MVNGELLLNGYRLSIWDDGKVLDLDGGGDRTAMSGFLLTLHTVFYGGHIVPQWEREHDRGKTENNTIPSKSS